MHFQWKSTTIACVEPYLKGDSQREVVQVKSGVRWRVEWAADSIITAKELREDRTRVLRESCRSP